MKKIIPVILAIALLSQACKEVGPPVDILPGNTKTVDTTYVADVEDPQPPKALFEKFTGVSCSNCPNAQKIIDGISDNNQGKAYTIAYHIKNSNFTKPIENITNIDLRNPKATDLHNYLANANDPGLPKGGVNRIKEGNGYWVASSKWSGLADDIFSKEATINLGLSCTYNADGQTATIITKTAYLSKNTSKQAITIILTEDKLVEPQKNVFVVDTFYEHNNVCRDVITRHSGDPILDDLTEKEAGRGL